MKSAKFILTFGVISTLIGCFFLICSGNSKQKNQALLPFTGAVTHNIDSTYLQTFFKKYPDFQEVAPTVAELYKKELTYNWFLNKEMLPAGKQLLSQAMKLNEEGLYLNAPYLDTIIFLLAHPVCHFENEVFLSALYFYYCNRVFGGLPPDVIRKTGWLIPKNKRDFISLLPYFVTHPGYILSDTLLIPQYYFLKKSLSKYKSIEARGGWKKIDFPKNEKIILGQKHNLVPVIRERLQLEGYNTGSKNNTFDLSLLEAVNQYQLQHNLKVGNVINVEITNALNVTVAERIRTICLNMERCRWLDVPIGNEFVVVNIPGYSLYYLQNRKLVLKSRVVVGKIIHKTVVFQGDISEVVFAPYWYVPNSILVNEILPTVKSNPNYIKSNNFEWYGNRLRQRPSKNNALGRVKFLFPNSNNIYLHDTPSKQLFTEQNRAFSHGCIRVEKAQELATLIMTKDFGWSQQMVHSLLESKSEKGFKLRHKIPVYIAYFTALADSTGTVSFYPDVYNKDQELMRLMLAY